MISCIFPYDSCIGVKRGKFVATIHDAKPFIFPQPAKRFDWKNRVKKLVLPNPRRQIDHIITVSNHSRKDLIEQLGIAEDNITVIYQGVESKKFAPSSSNVEGPYGEKRYVLGVAGKDPTKNIENLVIAYSLLPVDLRTKHSLVLAGDVGERKDIQQLVLGRGIESDTIFAGVVSDERLITLYQHASVFVFPSLYEGFGLPVLEAMGCGCPVITSQTSSLPEVVGTAGKMVDPLNVPELVEAMIQVLTDEELSRYMQDLGLSHARRFSWHKTARETVALYEKVGNMS